MGASSPPVLAQPDAFELHLALAQGETLYYNASISLRESVDMLGQRKASTVEAQGRLVNRVFEVDDTGTMLLESVLEDARTTLDGNPRAEIYPPSLVKVTRDARAVEQQTGRADIMDLEDVPAGLPGRPVRVGESWSGQVEKNFAASSL